MFVSEPIDVIKDPDDNKPLEFTWKGKQLKIVNIITAWQNWGFSSGVSKPTWRQRHHRNYYQVKCDDSNIYEIYLDRKSVDKQFWVLYRIIDKSDFSNKE